MNPISKTYNVKIEFIRSNKIQHTVKYTLISPHIMTKKKIRRIFRGLLNEYLETMPDLVLTTFCNFSINNQHFRLAFNKKTFSKSTKVGKLWQYREYKNNRDFFDYFYGKLSRKNK